MGDRCTCRPGRSDLLLGNEFAPPGSESFRSRAWGRMDSWTAPVGCFPPDGYVTYDMAWSVWEWTSGWYSARHPGEAESPCCVPRNPRGAA
ncbi:MAG: SUMF1/EgtB/PvdO family nonheme iron enzyme [Acetobacteraceae bacterium]|nr:SUMF1/EgtB/PvdO family nonheme iron enzyme [Acetobacteraceae bacterium]